MKLSLLIFSIENETKFTKKAFLNWRRKRSDDKLEFKRRLSRGEDIYWSSVAEEQTLLSLPS